MAEAGSISTMREVTSGPWMPYECGSTLVTRLHRDTALRLSQLVSGLPGDFVFQQFVCRLSTFTHQNALPQARRVEGLVPGTSYYEQLSSPEAVLNLLADAAEHRHICDGIASGGIKLPITLGLYADAYSTRPQRHIGLPAANARYKGDHTIFAQGVAGDTLTFRHNWDGWSDDWTMPTRYVLEHGVEAWYQGPIGLALGFDFQQGDWRDIRPQLNTHEPPHPALLTPADAGIHIYGETGASYVDQRPVFRLLAVSDGPSTSTILGWAHVSFPQGGPVLVRTLRQA